MNFRTTTILLVALVVVGLILIFTRDSGGPKVEEPTSAKLLNISSLEITKIAFTNDDNQHIVLERTDGKWHLNEPVKGPADDTAANGLADALAAMQAKGQIDLGADTGLDQPHFKLEITTKDGKTTKLDVGARSGAGNNLYVHRDGQARADVVQADLYSQLDKPLKQWRRDKLFDASSTDIKQIRVATTQGSYALEKQGNEWKIAQPTSMPADLSSVTDIAIAVTNLRADDFISENAADQQSRKYGLDNPTMTVSFSTAAPSTQPSASQPTLTTVQFGRYDGLLKKDVYASTSAQPGVVTIAATSLDSFRKKPLDLRDRKVLSVDSDKVTKIGITIEKPATTQPTTREAVHETVSLERAKTVTMATTAPATGPATTQASTQPSEPPSKWQVASKDNVNADDSKVDQLLSELNPFRIDKFLESASPTTQPSATYTLTIDTTDATHELKFVDPGNNLPPIGTYDGLTFEAPRFIIEKLNDDYVKKPGSSSPAPSGLPPGVAAPGMMP